MNNEPKNILYFIERKEFREWLVKNAKIEPEIWLIYPKKHTGKPKMLYNDAVEEALCFGWIDSIVRKYDSDHTMQRFTPRNPKSKFSQANKERLKWLAKNNLLQAEVLSLVQPLIKEEFLFPEDILIEIRQVPDAWHYYKKFSLPYRRIRIAYVDSARKRPEEFRKRLNNFISKTLQNKKIKGYGGIEKYY